MNRPWKRIALGTLVGLTTLTIAVGDNLDLSWFTIDAGGEMWIGGDDLELSGTIGQHDASVMVMTGGNLELTGGFWKPVGRAFERRSLTPDAREPAGQDYEQAEEQPLPSP